MHFIPHSLGLALCCRYKKIRSYLGKHSVSRPLGLDMWHNLLSLQLLLLAMIAWQEECNAVCCYSTPITFNLKDKAKQKCNDFPGGMKTWISKLDCKTILCGNLAKPTPYCGVGSCNAFGCSCKEGCQGNKGMTALDEFKKKFGKKLGTIKE